MKYIICLLCLLALVACRTPQEINKDIWTKYKAEKGEQIAEEDLEELANSIHVNHIDTAACGYALKGNGERARVLAARGLPITRIRVQLLLEGKRPSEVEKNILEKARNPQTSPETIQILASSNLEVKKFLAGNPNTPEHLLLHWACNGQGPVKKEMVDKRDSEKLFLEMIRCFRNNLPDHNLLHDLKEKYQGKNEKIMKALLEKEAKWKKSLPAVIFNKIK